jgi:C-terminal processing protease CtpA/Prc
LDKRGHERKEVTLSGEFEANQTKTITTKDKIDKYDYRKIYKWKTVSAEKSIFLTDLGTIGIEFSNRIIIDIYPESPAEKAGLKIGDIMIEANGIELNGDIDHDSSLITGDSGSLLTLKVLRATKQITFDIIRELPSY